MKRFQFELEDILRFRKFERRQAEMALGKALEAERGIQSELDALAAHLAAVERGTAGATDFDAITAASRFYDFSESRKEALLEKMAAAKLVTEEKRGALKEIMQKTDALERLRTDRQEEYGRDAEREESDAADDLVTARFRR